MNYPIFLSTIAVALLVVAPACDQSEDTDSLRVLPIAATTLEGDEVFVGTYDEASDQLILIPSFVDELHGASAGFELELAHGSEHETVTTQVTWPSSLDVGSDIDILVHTGEDSTIAGHLVIHARGWTDSLTENEAASLYGECLSLGDDVGCGNCPAPG